MPFERQDVLLKLNQYFNQELSQGELYQWALQIAVSDDYAKVVQKDPLVKEVLDALLEMQHMDLKVIPTGKALEYYRRCLAGEEKYIPLRERKDLYKLNIPERAVSGQARKQKFSFTLFSFARGYVVLFGLAIVGIYAVSFFMPDLLGSTLGGGSLLQASLHILYALMLVLPLRIMAKGFLFYLSFPVLVLGALYFWSIPLRLFHHFVLILLALPLSAIPATLAVILLARQKEKQK